MKTVKLDELRSGISGISPNFGAWMCECCVVCFQSQMHEANVKLRLLTDYIEKSTETYSINWEVGVSEENLKSHNDENRGTDFGSMAIALLLALQLTEYNSFETSQTGSGIDFWLSNDSDELNFLGGGRLEVSGIRKANKNNSLDKRVKMKLDQTAKSDGTSLPAYVAVIEFGKPEGAFVKK